jgi:hypothetical protein
MVNYDTTPCKPIINKKEEPKDSNTPDLNTLNFLDPSVHFIIQLYIKNIYKYSYLKQLIFFTLEGIFVILLFIKYYIDKNTLTQININK